MHKILIAEDELTLLKISAKRLERAGYQVIKATDGQEAIDLAIREKPDLIILDIKMPNKDGIQACIEMKSNPLTKEIKIIAFSAKAELSDKRRATEAGIDVYLTKPMVFDQVIDEIANLLGG